MAFKPERAEWNGSTFITFEVGVVRQVYNGKDNPPKEVELTFGVSVWNEKLFPMAESLHIGQGVQVTAELDNKQTTGNNGQVYDNLRLRPLAIVPGVVPASAGAPGAASPQRPQQGGGYQQQGGGYRQSSPQQQYQNTAPRPHAPATMPNEADDDIPF